MGAAPTEEPKDDTSTDEVVITPESDDTAKTDEPSGDEANAPEDNG